MQARRTSAALFRLVFMAEPLGAGWREGRSGHFLDRLLSGFASWVRASSSGVFDVKHDRDED